MRPDQSNLTIDTESGGDDPARDALLEIGAVLEVPVPAVDLITEQIIDYVPQRFEFHQLVLPSPGLRVDPRCWTVPWNRFRSLEQWRELGAVDEYTALTWFRRWLLSHQAAYLRDAVPWAHNVEHDAGFITKASKRNDIPLPIDHHWCCTMSTSWCWRRLSGQPGSVGLATMATLAGHWTQQQAQDLHHDALEDARATVAVREWLLTRLQAVEVAA